MSDAEILRHALRCILDVIAQHKAGFEAYLAHSAAIARAASLDDEVAA